MRSLSTFISLFSLFLVFQTQAQSLISPYQTPEHLSEDCLVEGWVHDVKVIQNEQGGVAFIHFEKAYPNNPFKIVIFGKQFDKFPEDLAAHYSQKHVRIKGKISTDSKGKPQIIANQESDITIIPNK